MKFDVQSNEHETGMVNRELFIIKSENEAVADEIYRLTNTNNALAKDKQNIKAAIIFLNKNINKLKAAVIREDSKTNEFISEVSLLVDRHSPNQSRMMSSTNFRNNNS